MAILHDKKCAFVHIPKAAGTTILSVITETYNEGGAISIATKTQPHEDIIQIKNRLGKDFDKYFKFGFVRNPWDRAVSIFSKRYKKAHPNATFREFIERYTNTTSFDNHASKRPKKLYLDWFRDNSGKVIVDFIGKYENLEEDLKFVCSKINIQPKKIPLLSVSKDKKHYTEYYDKKCIDIIAKRFAKDIEYFGYKFK